MFNVINIYALAHLKHLIFAVLERQLYNSG